MYEFLGLAFTGACSFVLGWWFRGGFHTVEMLSDKT